MRERSNNHTKFKKKPKGPGRPKEKIRKKQYYSRSIQHMSDEEKDRLYKSFVRAYIKVGTISGASSMIDVRYPVMKRLLEKEPYKTHFETVAQDLFADALEGEAVKRAMKKSDYLLGMLLKANRRSKFGDKLDVEANQTTTVKLNFQNTMLSPSEQKLIGGGEADG